MGVMKFKGSIGMLIFLFLFVAKANAQKVDKIGAGANLSKDTIPMQIVDNAKYRVYYKLTFCKDSTATDLKTEAQTILLVGSKFSSFLDYNALRKDSLFNALSKTGLGTMEIVGRIMPIGRQIKFEPTIMKNFPQKDVYTFQQMITARDNYRYVDEGVKIKWKLEAGEKVLQGYTCKKATCTYRGRCYIAWYCPDIAMNDGPYVFTGLPGLILEIFDVKGHYKFTMNGLNKVTGFDPLYFTANNVETLSRDKVRKVISNLRANPASILQLMGGRATVSPETLKKIKPKPHNPIELE